MTYAHNLAEFLNGCHSAFHSTALIEKELIEAGFAQLHEDDAWKLESNRYYYVKRNNTSIIAFKLPEMIQVKSLNIVASHSDSPTFKVKPVADLKDPHYNRLNVEAYGGALYSTWLDRPLSLAGRVVVKEDGKLVSRLLDIDRDIAIIPNVAIHQNREANNGYKWNPQVDMLPVVGLEKGEGYFKRLIAAQLGVETDDIYGYDVYLYNRCKGYLWGEDDEFISAPRLDDLACAYSSLQAFKYSYSERAVNIFAVFDNEEVGSETRQGMASTFLKDVIDRIFSSFFFSRDDVARIMANSFMISADNAHAVHPNHPELYDQENRCYLNKGIVIKRNAAQSYVTDSLSEAVMKELCVRSGVPYQFFANRSDSRGGGTQASIAVFNISSMAVDIGLPQLAMHSSFETGGSKDVGYMIAMLKEFYNSAILSDGDTVTILK